MPLVAAIRISQGGNCDRFVIEDISNYVEAGEPTSGFTDRKLIIYKADGTVYRKPGQLTDELSFTYINFPTNQITIDGLTSDLALHVVTTLTPAIVVGGSTYSVTSKFALVCYTTGYLVERAKKMQFNRRYEENINFVTNTAAIMVNAMLAPIAAAGDDISSAQLELDHAKRIYQRNPIPN